MKYRSCLLLSALAILTLSACTKKEEAPVEQAPPAANSAPEQASGEKTLTKVTELKIEDIKVGTGDTAAAGKMITVHYTGTLTDGTKFDSSLDRNQPFEFKLGDGQVIEGWDKGLVGMKVAGKRKITIPGKMAYGDAGRPPTIPSDATLVFEVDLSGVK